MNDLGACEHLNDPPCEAGLMCDACFEEHWPYCAVCLALAREDQ